MADCNIAHVLTNRDATRESMRARIQRNLRIMRGISKCAHATPLTRKTGSPHLKKKNFSFNPYENIKYSGNCEIILL